jgi:hypothetical protein
MKRRYIPVDTVYNALLTDFAAALLPFHALTGCDSTSFFANHTKKSASKMFENCHQLLTSLGKDDFFAKL